MKYSIALFAAAAALVSAVNQSVSDFLPACAIDCITTAIGDATTCKGPEDLECFCIADNYRAIYTSAVACVLQACGNDVSVGTRILMLLACPPSTLVQVLTSCSLGEVLPAAARMCEVVTGQSGTPTTTAENPSSTSSGGPAANQSTAPAETTNTAAAAATTTTNVPGSGGVALGAGMFAAVAPLLLVAAANA